MIRTVPETGSTNADLAAQLRAGEALGEGSWLVADRQTAGRGRQGRTWFDGHGNFMGSTIVRPHERDPAPASLALVTALAVYEAVVPLIAKPSELTLKWPNDLMLAGAKLSGILLEREGDAIIVGIGVNLAAAPDLPDRRTVALSAFGPAPERDTFARSLAASFDRELDRWRSFGLEPLVRRWESVAHPQGTSLRVHPPGEEPILGAYAGLTEDGALRLRLAGGESRVIHAGDVMFANEEG
ncbi:biotin--[acetyl-CoA-carboxylase] ligase [Qipengyuania aurantiaca]|uniref:biotin--[biotin carboxyl-carrier protein] ligase n=1 Tax=Qipengyuania aurantiaca TaxID=2867233 RepID=A0ABX8ZPH5_9SPHN|nr:biotin--[acetyl-CoA-carboxylase] ligase [Qipengyuania aurantiaca]QZD89639.1 biotin--[acetyl-CoA-carboxylase] ligase [Qipengyuania aurantiaca]